MKAERMGLLVLALAVVLAAGPPPIVEGSGFQLIEQNGSGLGNAFAGQAAGVHDASAIFFNPAALTRLGGRQVVVSVEPIGVGTDFTDARSGRPFLPVQTGLILPVAVAATYEGGRFEVLADWTYTGWSSIQELEIVRTNGSALRTVPLRFEDTWRAGLGMNYRLDNRRKLRLGAAWDASPVQDEFRTPRLPDEDRAWAAAGFEWKLGDRTAVDVGYAHVFVNKATSNRPNQETAGSAPAGALVGDYSAKVDILSVQFRLAF